MVSERGAFATSRCDIIQGIPDASFSLRRSSLNAYSQTHIEPPGPSSRRTPIAISEIMYKPAARTDGRNTEFIELYNSNPWPEDISGYRLDGQVQFVFPAPTTIPAQGYLVVAAVPADLQAVYGLTNVFGPYTNSLKTSGTVKLYDEQGSLLLQHRIRHAAPWPMGADGTGHSIVLARPSYGEGDPRAWDRSDSRGWFARSRGDELGEPVAQRGAQRSPRAHRSARTRFHRTVQSRQQSGGPLRLHVER